MLDRVGIIQIKVEINLAVLAEGFKKPVVLAQSPDPLQVGALDGIKNVPGLLPLASHEVPGAGELQAHILSTFAAEKALIKVPFHKRGKFGQGPHKRAFMANWPG